MARSLQQHVANRGIQLVCATHTQGGHTSALLQIIKDDGSFFGWVGIEASLNSRAGGCWGGAIIALEDITYAK